MKGSKENTYKIALGRLEAKVLKRHEFTWEDDTKWILT
jgi:hypothetical protein